MHVLQMPGEAHGLALAHILQRHVQGNMAGIGLRRSGHQHRGIAQGDPGFRHSQLQGHIHAGIDDGDDLGKCQTHILRRDHHQAAAGRLHLPRLQKPGQVMAGSIRVRAPDGLLQSRQQVIVVIPVPVGPQGTLLGHSFGIRQGQGQLVPLRDSGGEQHLHRVHSLAQIAAAASRNILQSTFLGNRRQSRALLHKGHRPLYRLQCRLGVDLLEFKHRGPAQNRVEHIEVRILRGGGNEGDFAVFDVLQEGLLLLFVEGLNLVQIQQHPVRGHEGVQLGHDLLDVSRGGGGGIQLEQGPVGLLRNDVGNGGLSGAAGAVEDHVGDLPGVDEPPQHRALAQNMLLSEHLVQGCRPKQIG